MKLQIKFKVQLEDGTFKKASKTFSNINEGAGNDAFIEFAKAYQSLTPGKELEVYLISVRNITGGADAN